MRPASLPLPWNETYLEGVPLASNAPLPRALGRARMLGREGQGAQRVHALISPSRAPLKMSRPSQELEMWLTPLACACSSVRV